MDCETGKIFAVKKFNLSLPFLESSSQRELEVSLITFPPYIRSLE